MKGGIRHPGGGRKPKEENLPGLRAALDEVIAAHTAGCPVEGVKWTYLKRSEIKSRLAAKGYQISRRVLRRLLRLAELGQRKLFKNRIMKQHIAGRDEQFEMIRSYRNYYLARGYAVISVDVKKKEVLGPYFRAGQLMSTGSVECYDHDFNSFSSGKVVPHGIYDLGRNEGYITLGQSADTAEFNVACLRQYWQEHGAKVYPAHMPVLLLLDGGGSNGSRNRLFKQELQEWADEFGLNIRVAHYPPYCSKYNPIEHRLFPFITRALEGVMLDSVQTIKKLIEERTEDLACGLRIFVSHLEQTFEKGVTVFDDYLEHCRIKFEKKNRTWNYRVAPM